MNYYIYGFTDKGNVRSHNEDSILVDHEVSQNGSLSASVSAPFLSAVCDGVGGEQAGEIASKLCLQHLAILDYDSRVDLTDTLMTVHNKIKKRGIAHEESVNMQTTLCCLAVDESKNVTCINVGDSRMYRYVNGKARQISVDQTYGQFLYEQGEINDINELEPQMRSAIVSSMGSVMQDPKIDFIPFVSKFGEEKDDTVLIFSDGVSDFVSVDEIEIAMAMDISFDDKIESICELALKNGSTDNISAVGIKPYATEEEYAQLTHKFVEVEPVDEIEPEIEMAVEEKQMAEESIAELEQFISDLDNDVKTD